MTEQPTPPTDRQTDDQTGPLPEAAFNADVPHATPERPLNEVARRALLEAAERRAAEAAAALPNEVGGRKGPEPTRFGDWEKKGLAVDF